MSSESSPVAALSNITKRFPGVLANDGISLDFHGEEIHVLLGENGAGKSTLIGMLAGMHQPDAGEIRIGGRAVKIRSPRESLALGVGTVFQHVLLVPTLTVIENLMLGAGWWRPLGYAAALARFRQLSSQLGLSIDALAKVGRLSLGEQQQIEVLRALWRGGRLLILDEPTAMLTPQGAQHLGGVMRRLKEQGVALLLVTHKLPEACQWGDRISVLRRGRLIGQIPPDTLRGMSEAQTRDAALGMMFGGEAATRDGAVRRGERSFSGERRGDGGTPPRLSVRALRTVASPGECPLREVSFEVWPGEILGIAGIDGNGQKHLAEVLAGQRRALQGEITLEGVEVTAEDVAGRRRRGIRYITDDRIMEGTIGGFSVAINLLLKDIGDPPYWRHGISDFALIQRHAREVIRNNDIRTPSEKTPLARLSGGNIQKVVLARELDGEASVAILSKPTHGLDLHNCLLAHERILASAQRGVTFILISTDLDDELLVISDRIAVMFQGRLTGVVQNVAGAARAVARLMTGAVGP